MSLADTLTEEQTRALANFGAACQHFAEAQAQLSAAGLEITDALKLITDEEGNSLYEQLPPAIRMLL